MKWPKFFPSSESRTYIVPTRYGFVYAFIVFLMLALATIFNNSDCLLATALLVTFGVVCMQQTHLNIAQVTLKNVDSQSGFAGESIPWRIKVQNQNSEAAFSLNIYDDVFDVPGKDATIENVNLKPMSRGFFHLDKLKISSTYPLGLFYSWKWAEVDVNYYVYPHLGPPEIVIANLTETRSELESKDDFIGHRDFVAGDSAHHVDWKAHARKQKLLVKLFESHSTTASILDWTKVPGKDLEERLSILTRAIHECYITQTPFGLKMPDQQISIDSGPLHYERCLKYLATFGLPHEKAA